jgi:hypothetical protein
MKIWWLVCSYCAEDNWARVFSRNNSLQTLCLILSSFIHQLADEEKSCGHLMEGNATTHAADNSMPSLGEVFGE